MCNIKKLGERACMGTVARQVALESVWEVTLLEIFFTFDLVWVPWQGLAWHPRLLLICFSVVSLNVRPWNSIRV